MADFRIKTFLTLYKTMNYRIAAEELNMTQPAVTQHIQMLEREYCCKFFVYDRRRLYRTPEAEKFCVYCRGLLYNEEQFKLELSRDLPKVLRVGATKTIGEFVLTDTIEKYLKTPKHSLSFYVDNTTQLLKKIENAELDFALVEGNFNKEKFDSRLFCMEPFVGICAKNHRFAGKSVPVSALFDNTVIAREEGSGTRAVMEHLLGDFGYGIADFSRCVCISNFSLICRLVSDNVGISFVYRAVADSYDNVAVFSLKGVPAAHEFNYVYLKNTDAGKLIDRFMKDNKD